MLRAKPRGSPFRAALLAAPSVPLLGPLRSGSSTSTGGDGIGGLVACLGNVVHNMTPNLTQGACLAVEEALALPAELRLGRKGAGDCDVAAAVGWAVESRRLRTLAVQLLLPMVHGVGAAT